MAPKTLRRAPLHERGALTDDVETPTTSDGALTEGAGTREGGLASE